MPTGYTSDLHDGKPITFPEFAAKCAYAFGALMEFRDSAPRTDLPEETEGVSDYYPKDIERTQTRIREIEAWTPEESTSAADAAYEKEVAERHDSEVKRSAMKLRYEAMLDQVRAWTPPSPDHDGLKVFMVEQIEGSIKFDCGDLSWWKTPIRKSGAEYRDAELERLRKHLDYAQEQLAGEIARVQDRQKWVAALRDSLELANA